MVITIDKAEASIVLTVTVMKARATLMDEETPLAEIILREAQELVKSRGVNRFRAPELYYSAQCLID